MCMRIVCAHASEHEPANRVWIVQSEQLSCLQLFVPHPGVCARAVYVCAYMRAQSLCARMCAHSVCVRVRSLHTRACVCTCARAQVCTLARTHSQPHSRSRSRSHPTSNRRSGRGGGSTHGEPSDARIPPDIRRRRQKRRGDAQETMPCTSSPLHDTTRPLYNTPPTGRYLWCRSRDHATHVKPTTRYYTPTI